VAVVRRDGQAPRPLLFDGSPLLPSGVYRDERGALSVGRDAERLSQLDPTRFEPYPKRCVDDGAVLLGDAATPVVDLLAALLRRVVGEASPEDGTPRQVTLTCPADWGPQRREVLRTAARAAGLPDVRLVDEPIAAATYCAEVLGQPIPVGQCLLVFDFGGGTLDVTVVRRDPDGLRVLAVGGLDDLGGVDIDAALVGHLGQLVALRQPQVWQRLVDPRSTAEQRDRRRFWTEVRAAKEMLSRAPSAPIQVPGSDDAIHLTREELERVAGPLVDRAVDETRRVLGRAGVGFGPGNGVPGGPGNGGPGGPVLAGILLVGGSSRIPLVASRLHARFGVAPTVPEQPELPVAYGGLYIARPARQGPASPATGPSGPVSVAPYAVSPAPPPNWTPPPIAPPSVPYLPTPSPTPAPRRSPVRLLVTLGVVLAILVAVGYGGVKIFGAATQALHGFPSITGGNATGNGAGNGGAQLGSGGGLQLAGAPIDLSGDGARAVTAGANLVFYAVGGNGNIVVHAAEPATGKEKWARTVAVDPAEARLHTVGDLLVLDATKSASDAGKDIRVVLATSDGHQVQKLDWSNRDDVAYLGTDAIVATTWQPYQTLRVNLRTGQTVWKSPPIASIIAYHPVSPVLTWSVGPANVPAPQKGFTESFGVNPDRFVQLDASKATVQVVNGAGKVVTSGPVPIDDPVNDRLWTAFDGLVVGALNDEAAPGRAAVGGYRVDNLKQAWTPVGLSPGDEVKYVHPCAEHLVCVTYQKKSDDNPAVFAIETTTGKRINWASPPPFGDFSSDPYWLVLGNQMLYGEGSFPPQLGCRDTGLAVLDPNTGAATHELFPVKSACSAQAMAGAGRYVAVRNISVAVPSGRVSWQASVVDLSTGKQTDTMDLGASDKQVPEVLAVSGTTLAAVGTDHKLRIATTKLS
jgi:hypothetical protein